MKAWLTIRNWKESVESIGEIATSQDKFTHKHLHLYPSHVLAKESEDRQDSGGIHFHGLFLLSVV